MSNVLKHYDVWQSAYRGFGFKICRWRMGAADTFENCWSYYVYIPIDNLPESLKAGAWIDEREMSRIGDNCPVRGWYDYNNSWVASDVEWHGGVTYYEKLMVNGEPGTGRIAEFGCDFQHAFDRGREYTKELIVNEAEGTINGIIECIEREESHHEQPTVAP